MLPTYVFTYAGQGGQFTGMGLDLYHADAAFRADLELLDSVAQEATGEGILPHLFGPRVMTDVLVSNPAIFAVQYAATRLLERAGCRADYVLGMSMGEFAAASAAGLFDPVAAMNSVLRHARVITDTCPPGGMLAVVEDPAVLNACPVREWELVLRGSSHFVAAGVEDVVGAIEAFLLAGGIPYRRLPVRHGFHSAAIDAAQEGFVASIPPEDIRPAKVCFVSSAFPARITAQPGTVVNPGHFWEAIRRPIEFSAAVRALRSTCEYIFVDLGPGGVASNLLRQDGVATTRVHTLLDPYTDGAAAFRRLVTQLTSA